MQFKIGDTVRKTKGSKWQGKIVGQYSTELTPNGYAIESDTETGSVQIYPASALELAAAGGVSGRADELIACLEAEVKSRDARLLEMDAQCMLAGVALDLVVAEATKLRAELAAFKAQEPVAYIPVDRSTGDEWPPVYVKGSGKICDYAPLYAAPVAKQVVMPERRTESMGLSHDQCAWIDGWNDCLDKFTRLNTADQEGGQDE